MDQLQGGGLVFQADQGVFTLCRQADDPLLIQASKGLFGDIGEKDVKDVPIGAGVDEVAVVLDPAEFPILTDDAVIHPVQVPALLHDLLPDALRHPFPVLGIDQALESTAGIGPKILFILAAVHLD